MCGIAGIVTADMEARPDSGLLREMIDVVRHRGPDSNGFYLDRGIGLGVARLSINDVRGGRQPIYNEDRTVVVVCNGEIYNFHELREDLEAKGHRFRTRSDTEVIVHLYEDYGENCVLRLRGMFGLAVWDTRRRRLLLARDRIGIKPLHYALLSGDLCFSSEQKSILVTGLLDRDLDVTALRQLFTYGFITGPRTLFKRIHRLEPGHYLTYRAGRLSIRRYWDVEFPIEDDAYPNMSADAWAEALLEKLRESVKIHMRSDVPVGAMLSGGVDSSAVAALMGDGVDSPLPAFSLAFRNPHVDEMAKSPTLDRFPGFNLQRQTYLLTDEDFQLFPLAIQHLEMPYAGATFVSRMAIARLAAEKVKVVLTGEGADEVFGSYEWFRAEKLFQLIAHLPHWLLGIMSQGFDCIPRWKWVGRFLIPPIEITPQRYGRMVGTRHPRELESLFSDEMKVRIAESDESIYPDMRESRTINRHPHHKLQYLEIKTRLPDYVIETLDKTSMAYSVEARVPFLDHELIELCAGIPPSLKIRGLREKHILRRAMAKSLPRDIVKRKKLGLSSPIRDWLRSKLPEFARECLSESKIREAGYFHPRSVQTVLDLHRTGRDNYQFELSCVLAAQVWHEIFIRGSRPEAWSTPAPNGS